ncbi:MAG: ATP-binding protein [Legionellales bacterium]
MLTDTYFWENLIKDAIHSKAEYNFLDFKKALSEDNERLKEHINAFGNLERGGCFVIGVDQYIPVGLSDNWDETIKRISSLAKNSQEPSLDVNVFPLSIENKKLLCLHILPAKSKPVFINDRAPLGGRACFKRTGSSTIAMSAQEIKDLLSHAQEFYYDESIVNDADLDDLDFEKIVKFLPNIDKNNIKSEKNISILIDNRVLIGDKHSPRISVAGWLCFAKNVQQIRLFRNAYIELQIFRGVARDFPIKKYEIKNALSHQIEEAIQILKQNIWYIPKIQGSKREDVLAYPEIILREVITNSVVHRDYKKMHQPVKIAFFSNRIEIENPGGLMPGLTVFNLIHKRDWRNPLLAEIMRKFGLGEMDGQGIDRLYAQTLAIKVPPPGLINSENSFKLILHAPKSYEEFAPKEKQDMMIILAVLQESVDNESVRNCFGISSEKASTLIKAMVADKIFEPINDSRKYARYGLTENYRNKIFG